MSTKSVDEAATRAGAAQTSPQGYVQLQQEEGLTSEDTRTQHRGQQAWILDGQGSKVIKTASNPASSVTVLTAGAGEEHHTAHTDRPPHPERPISYVTSSPDDRISHLQPPPPVYKAATPVPTSARRPFASTAAPAIDQQSSAAVHLTSSTKGASASTAVSAPPALSPAPTLLYMPWRSSLLQPKKTKITMPASPLGDTSAGITVHAPIAAERMLHDLPPPPYRVIDSAVGRLRPQKGSAGVGVEVVSNFDGPPPSVIGACLSEEVPTSPIGDMPEEINENVADVMFAIGRVFGTRKADTGGNPHKITATTTMMTAGGDNSLAVGCNARDVCRRHTPRKDTEAITADLDHAEPPVTPSLALVPATVEHDWDRFGRVFGALRALGVPVNGDSADEFEACGEDGKHNEGEASGEEEKDEGGEAEGEEEEEEEEEEEKKRKKILGSLPVPRSPRPFEPNDSGREKRAKLEICSVLCCTAPLVSPTFAGNESGRGGRTSGPVQARRSPAAAEALMIRADAHGSAGHTASANEGREPVVAADHSVASVNVVDKMVAKIALAIASSRTTHTGSASSGTLAENVANPAPEEEGMTEGEATAAGAPSQEVACAFAGLRPGVEEGAVRRPAGKDSPHGAAMREPSSAGPVTSIWVTHGTPVVSGLAGAAADVGGEERPLTQGSASRRRARKAASRFGVLLQSFFFGSSLPEDARPSVSPSADGRPTSLAAHDEGEMVEQSTALARYGEDRDGVSGTAQAPNEDDYLSTPRYSDDAAAAPPSPTDPSPTMTYEGFTVEEVDQAAATVEEVAVQHFFEDDICTLYELPSPVGSVHDVPTPPSPEAEAEQCAPAMITQETPETQDEVQGGNKSSGVFLTLMEDVERTPSALVPTTPASVAVDESLPDDTTAPADPMIAAGIQAVRGTIEALSGSIGTAAVCHFASNEAHEVPAVTRGEGEPNPTIAVALGRQEGKEAFEVPMIPETVVGTDATASDAAAAAPTLSDCGVATRAEVPVVNKAGHVEAAAPAVEDVDGSSVEECTVAPTEDEVFDASVDVEAQQSVLVNVTEEASDNKGESESGGWLLTPARMLSPSRACLWPSAVTVQDSTVELIVGADPATAPGQISSAECSAVAVVPNLSLDDISQTVQKETSLRNPDETTVLETEDDPLKELGGATADGSVVVSSPKMESKKPASAGTEHGPEEPDSSHAETVSQNVVVRTRAETIPRAGQSAADASPVTLETGEGYKFLAVRATSEAEAVGDASRQYAADQPAAGGAPLNGQPEAEGGDQQLPTPVERTSIEAGIGCDGGWMYSVDVVTVGGVVECMQVPDTAGEDSFAPGGAGASSPSEDGTSRVQVLTGEMPNGPGAEGDLAAEPSTHDASVAVPSGKMEGDVTHLSAALGAGNSAALCTADTDFSVSGIELDTEDADSWWIPEDIDAAAFTQDGELLQQVELDEAETLAQDNAPYFAEATPAGGPRRSDANEVAVVPESAAPERTPLSSVSDEDLCMPLLVVDYSSSVYGLDDSTTSSDEVSDGELVQAMDIDFKEEPEDEVPVFTDAEEWGHPPLPPEERDVASTGGEAGSEGLLQAPVASAGDGAPGWSVVAPLAAATTVAEVTSSAAIEVSAVAARIEDAVAVAEQSTVPAVPIEHVAGAMFEEVAATVGVVPERKTEPCAPMVIDEEQGHADGAPRRTEPVEAVSAATDEASVGTTRLRAIHEIERAGAANDGPPLVGPSAFVLASALTDAPVVPGDEESSASASAPDDSSPATGGDCSPPASAGESGTSNVPTGIEEAQVRWEDKAGLASSASEPSSAMASEVPEAGGLEQAVEMVDDAPKEAAVFFAETTATAAAFDNTGGEEDVSHPQNVDCFAQVCGIGSILSPIDRGVETVDVPAAVEATAGEGARGHVAAEGEERFVVVYENSLAGEEATASASGQRGDLTQTSERVLLVTELDEMAFEVVPTTSGGDILESDTTIEVVPLPVDSVATLLARLKSDFVAGLHEELSVPVLRLIFPSAADESLRSAPADTPEVDTASLDNEGVSVDKPLVLEDAADDKPERLSKIACQLPTIDEADGVTEVVGSDPVSDAPPEDDHYESTRTFIGAADAAQGRSPLLSTRKEKLEDVGGVLTEQPGAVAAEDAPHVTFMENPAASSTDTAGEVPDISGILPDRGMGEAPPDDSMASGASPRSAGLTARSWAPSHTIGASVDLSDDLIDAASIDDGAFPSTTRVPCDFEDHESFRATAVGEVETNEEERSQHSVETTLPAVVDAYDAIKRECPVKSPATPPSPIGGDEDRPALLPEEWFTKTHDLDVFVLPSAEMADEKPEELQVTEYDGQSSDEVSVVPTGAVSSTALPTPQGKALSSPAAESEGERLSRVPVEDDMPAVVTPDDTPTDFLPETGANAAAILTADEGIKQGGGENCLTGPIAAPLKTIGSVNDIIKQAAAALAGQSESAGDSKILVGSTESARVPASVDSLIFGLRKDSSDTALNEPSPPSFGASPPAAPVEGSEMGDAPPGGIVVQMDKPEPLEEANEAEPPSTPEPILEAARELPKVTRMEDVAVVTESYADAEAPLEDQNAGGVVVEQSADVPAEGTPLGAVPEAQSEPSALLAGIALIVSSHLPSGEMDATTSEANGDGSDSTLQAALAAGAARGEDALLGMEVDGFETVAQELSPEATPLVGTGGSSVDFDGVSPAEITLSDTDEAVLIVPRVENVDPEMSGVAVAADSVAASKPEMEPDLASQSNLNEGASAANHSEQLRSTTNEIV